MAVLLGSIGALPVGLKGTTKRGITYKQMKFLADEIDSDYIYSKRFKGARNKAGDLATGLVIFDDGQNNFGEFVYEDKKNGKEYQSKEIPYFLLDFSKVPYYGKMAKGNKGKRKIGFVKL